MCSDSLENLSGAEVWTAAQHANPQASMTVEASTDREGKQEKTATEMQEILRRQSFPPNDDDQYFEPPRVGNPHRGVTEHAVQRPYWVNQSKCPGPRQAAFLRHPATLDVG
jgi:hypothetical protein